MNEESGEISTLSRERAVEAVLSMREAFGANVSAGTDSAQFLRSLDANPYAHIEDIEALARLFLVVAVADESLRDKTVKAVRGSGKKAFVFGGSELLAAASIAVLALQVVFSRGKSHEVESLTVEQDKQGSWKVSWKKNTRFGISGKVAALLDAIRGKK